MAVRSLKRHRNALEKALKADEILADPVHSALIQLARSLADQLDAEADAPQTRTQATYAGILNSIRRVVADARAERRKTQAVSKGSASRLELIKSQAAGIQKGNS